MVGTLYAPSLVDRTPTKPSYLSKKDIKKAEKYFEHLVREQRHDFKDHLNNFGIVSAVLSGLEGSNWRGAIHSTDSGDEWSSGDKGDTGVSWATAILFRGKDELRRNASNHSYITGLSLEIFIYGLGLEEKRKVGVDKRRPKRPQLNAYMRYRKGKSWKSALSYGKAAMAREYVIKRDYL